ncbi:uncharacterized protein N7482_003741 [Penicillium canariense]|uniref:Uncharacterized protein n=1 Tax=Penicillium canariense TaxID=189055 RepID=A0A9W9LNX8_9EURO|nr:uncharacterized protein N7482_003741 [Penicillium canariense]KAJ5168147.1 hypothetical protein N7482_003741 [Penicillium canariense]
MSSVYESVGVVSEEAGAGMFLAHLPSDTPVYCYNAKLDLESLFPPSSVEDRFVVVKNFPPETLAECEQQLPGRCDYSPLLQILIITMPTLPHEEGADAFGFMIRTLAQEMQLQRRLQYWVTTRVDTPDRSKQADRAWGPRRQGRESPTVALEVGFSETTAKLEKDIAWWINESHGVRMGITVHIKKASGSIEIRSWVPAITPSLSHVQIASRGRPIVDKNISNPAPPRVAQRIFIKRGKDGSTIEGGT